MGVFSWECQRCNKSILGEMATNETNGWMSHAVVLTKSGNRIIGLYDSYGNVDSFNLVDDGEDGEEIGGFTIYHESCWILADKPEFSKQSNYSRDQGWFFDDEDYDIADPLKVEKKAERK